VPIALDIRLPPQPVSGREARARIEALEASVGPDVLDDVSLLVSELVTNSVRHAVFEEGEAIQVSVIVDHVLRVEVHDPGPGFDQPPLEPDHPLRAAGWGLLLVDRLTDRWGIDRTSGTNVWFEIGLGTVYGADRPGRRPHDDPHGRRLEMGDKMDEAKGRAKEAVGDLTDDEKLKREGQMDQAGAAVKEKVGNAVDSAKDKVNEALDKD
jgi:uncharacterized protein YjbJ (UPF0337 family)/anti-sigma regulatory factor (Ser/Thr protein kinase)